MTEPSDTPRLDLLREATWMVMQSYQIEKLTPSEAAKLGDRLVAFQADDPDHYPRAIPLALSAIRRRARGVDDAAQLRKLRRRGEALERRVLRMTSTSPVLSLVLGRRW